MAIKTRYAVAKAGETSTAKPASRNTVTPSTQFFFPMNEGSGATVTAVGKAPLVIDDAGAWTVAWTGPTNSCSISGTLVAPTGTVPNIGATDSFVMWVAGRSATLLSLFTAAIGNTSGNGWVSLNGAGVSLKDDAAVNKAITISSGLTVGADHFMALVFDRATNVLSVWYGDKPMSITSTPTAQTSISGVGAITVADLMSFGGVSQHYYSYGLMVMDAIPSDYVEFLQELYATAFDSVPRIPDRWVDV